MQKLTRCISSGTYNDFIFDLEFGIPLPKIAHFYPPECCLAGQLPTGCLLMYKLMDGRNCISNLLGG